MAAHALPGSGSVINCVIQHYGPVGPTEFLTIEKFTALSQIPGLRHGIEEVANLPRPPTWDQRKLTPAAKQSISINALSLATYYPRKPESAEQVLEAMDDRLHEFFHYCETANVTKLAGL